MGKTRIAGKTGPKTAAKWDALQAALQKLQEPKRERKLDREPRVVQHSLPSDVGFSPGSRDGAIFRADVEDMQMTHTLVTKDGAVNGIKTIDGYFIYPPQEGIILPSERTMIAVPVAGRQALITEMTVVQNAPTVRRRRRRRTQG